MPYKNLGKFLDALKKAGDLHVVREPVDPEYEVGEIAQRAVREATRVLAPGGRLLIVDFAPHELEFLRDEYAHERLGFGGPLIAQWFADCGVELIETRELAPEAASQKGKLTVSLWLAGRPRAAEAITGDQRKLERTA